LRQVIQGKAEVITSAFALFPGIATDKFRLQVLQVLEHLEPHLV
jgi:hypothetical protein